MSTINVANTDKYRAVFSNIPVPSTRSGRMNLNIFNHYVKSITIPDYNQELIPLNFGREVRQQPISRRNNDLTQLIVEFKMDEDYDNYLTMFEWTQALRDGNKTADTFHTSNINSIDVIMNDNENRQRANLRFTECFLINLSSLPMTFGSSEELLFTCTFQYTQFKVERSTTTTNN